MLKRSALQYLKQWQNRVNRKPLVVRGARQVGKSFLVRIFAQEAGLDLVEINLELNDDCIGCFVSKDPFQIITLLELKISHKIVPGKTLLFLDEIQTAPQILATLRYFYELMPELHLITAGSLLEFVLEDHTFSMPVGRIEYLHLGPMTFKEFLTGIGRDKLRIFIEQFQIKDNSLWLFTMNCCLYLEFIVSWAGCRRRFRHINIVVLCLMSTASNSQLF